MLKAIVSYIRIWKDWSITKILCMRSILSMKSLRFNKEVIGPEASLANTDFPSMYLYSEYSEEIHRI